MRETGRLKPPVDSRPPNSSRLKFNPPPATTKELTKQRNNSTLDITNVADKDIPAATAKQGKKTQDRPQDSART